MKNVFLIAALTIGIQVMASESPTVASPHPTAGNVVASADEYVVTAYINPQAGIKIKCKLTVTWDGSTSIVIGRDGRSITPVVARYSRTYQGYPYCVSIGNQTWYFAL